MRFEVKGKEYFLAFVEDERRWYVFSPGAQGLERMPVYMDAPKAERAGLSELSSHGGKQQ